MSKLIKRAHILIEILAIALLLLALIFHPSPDQGWREYLLEVLRRIW